jgi:pimeloyl-ACP methyl ester carboxylesterase
MSDGARRYVDAGGVSVACRDVGEGEPVVFLHGFPGPESWSAVVDRLRGHFRCIVVETLGLGDARGPVDADYTLRGQASVVRHVLDALGVESAHLVGNDTGGAIAQVFATRWPGAVRRLVLSDCDAFDNWPPPQVKRLQRLLRIPGGPRLAATAMGLSLVARSGLGFGRLVSDRRLLTRDRLARYARPLRSSPASRERFRRFVLALDSRYTVEIEAALRSLTHPTMIVWGGDDAYWTPSWAKALFDAIPGAERLELIPFAGLSCHEEQPDTFAHLLRSFLAPVGPATAGVPVSRGTA